MCGFCGEVRIDGGVIVPEAIAAMRDQMPHRGPDASGLYTSPSGRAGLGFRRLKIVDLSDGANQPMPNEDGTVQVVFNGEIYNFRALRAQLQNQGHRFRSRSDTEVIAHLYEEQGLDAIERLDGMFALAIWDERRGRLVLARDRAGKKPLYYRTSGESVLFASEIKAFFVRDDVEIAIDREAVPYYFLYGYVDGPHTFYQGIRQVEPGTFLSLELDGRLTSRRYWSLRFPTEADIRAAPEGGGTRSRPDRASARRELRRLMTEAVERRLVADVPLGAFLSGGLDSTIVVGLMSRLAGRVKTFSIGFKDSPGYDETRYAGLAAGRFGTDHTEFIVEPGAFDLVERLVWHHDGPFGDSSAVPTYLVSRLTREQVTVVLTGDGGDELFAGYARFRAAVVAERTPRVLRTALGLIGGHLRPGASARALRSRIQRFSAAASLPLPDRLARWAGLFHGDLDRLLAPELRAGLGGVDPLRNIRGLEDRLRGLSPLSQALAINFNTYLPDDLLVKTDRCTMANSLEARSPFLDTALMEYAARLPDGLKLAGGRTKVILREAFDDLVPHEIQTRGKMGFGVPFGAWFRGALREPLGDLLLSRTACYRDYLSAEYVRALVERHDRGEADLGLPLWTILAFETWLRLLPRWTRRAAPAASAT